MVCAALYSCGSSPDTRPLARFGPSNRLSGADPSGFNGFTEFRDNVLIPAGVSYFTAMAFNAAGTYFFFQPHRSPTSLPMP